MARAIALLLAFAAAAFFQRAATPSRRRKVPLALGAVLATGSLLVARIDDGAVGGTLLVLTALLVGIVGWAFARPQTKRRP